jgi:2Fe-2S ferredoxin
LRIVYVEPDGQRRITEMSAGENAMTCARRELVEGIVGECGGAMMCGTCHVYVAEGQLHLLPEPSSQEKELLSGVIEVRAESRLGCQIAAQCSIAELTVFVPDAQE